VYGLMRASLYNTDRIDHLYHDPHVQSPALTLHYGDLADGTASRRVLEKVEPDEIYNLRCKKPCARLLRGAGIYRRRRGAGHEALRDHIHHGGTAARFYQAGSSEMFGAAPPPQSERTQFYPCSPYDVSKAAAHSFAVNYREA
jgi:GDPmannose 4,6-dehydratase